MTPSKVQLIQAPTPLHRLEHASKDLGLDLWIKRDDLTGFAMGGNKGRKLEYLLADVLAQGAQTVVTCGAMQSNFIRQLGAACAVFGIKCAAAVMKMPYEHEPPSEDGLWSESGNVTLDKWLGVDLHVYPDGEWDELYTRMEDLAQEFERRGQVVYRIPVGGSSPLGAYAFWEAGLELAAESPPPLVHRGRGQGGGGSGAFDWIVFASSSGSTQVGLSHRFRGTQTKVLGVLSDPEPEMADDFATLSAGLSLLIGEVPLKAEEFQVNLDAVGPGYGIPSEDGNKAISYLARTEGIFLDPIYSGKAFGALMALAKSGEIGGRVCFWHTGGVPALFAM